MDTSLIDFIVESNKIEKIFRDPTQSEIDEFYRFMNLDWIDVSDLEDFVSIYELGAKLRDQYGLNVKIGDYYPPFGSPDMRDALQGIIDRDYNAYFMHIAYEKLHPFTDGNGRSGRALWAWKMQDLTGGFLLNFYFQSLRCES